MSSVRLIVIVGFLIGATGIFIALPAEDRSLGFAIFQIGFFLAAIGIIANAYFIPSTEKTRPFLPGLKIASVGFGIVLLSVFIGMVLKRENMSSVFFYIGFVVSVIGILFGIFRVAKSRR